MNRPVVLVTHRVFPETLDLLNARFQVIANRDEEPLPRAELLRLASGADAMLAFMTDRVDAGFLDGCPRLRVVACALAGYDNFDVEACTRRGVWLTVVPDLLSDPTAELALGLAIGLARHIATADRIVRAGRFSGWRPRLYGTSLDASTVAIVGGGRLGRAIARKLRGFDCTVLVCDPRPSEGMPENARYAPAEEALVGADFVFLAVPLEAATAKMVNASWLERLKPGALLVNCARGSVVDEAAVARALEAGRLGGYAADVFAFEDWARPDRPAYVHPTLLELSDRTLFTAHLGSAVARARREIERYAALAIVEALDGARPRGAVNVPAPAGA
ncbi:MAG: phosphonate dehydrogenase [Burkholderiales bacterium]|nr:phosphonate dehydrogenase [Burkholderiales bacterium]